MSGRTAVVVSGTVTDRLAPAVASVVDAVRARQQVAPVVVAYGVCACSGGPYWDSYAVTKGVDALVPVDVYVPGCPPTPDALREVLDAVAGRAAGAAVSDVVAGRLARRGPRGAGGRARLVRLARAAWTRSGCPTSSGWCCRCAASTTRARPSCCCSAGCRGRSPGWRASATSTPGRPGTSARRPRSSAWSSSAATGGASCSTPGVETPLRKDDVLAARTAEPWPGAKEPGEGPAAGGGASPSRRRMVPPGVPAPEVWGDRDPALGPPDPAEVAAAVSGGRVRRRGR